MKEAVTKVIDTVKQEDFHGAFQKLLPEITFMCVLSIKVTIRKNSGTLLNDPRIYIYIYMCVCIFCQNFFINTYFIEHNRHFLSTYFFVNPFELQYWSYDSQRELVDKPSIISYFPSTFDLTLGHHQGRMYYESDVNFVCTLLPCKNERLYCCIVQRFFF